jgi:hypothetical protein
VTNAGALNAQQIRLLQQANESNADQLYVDHDPELKAIAEQLVGAGLGVFAWGHFIVNARGEAIAALYPREKAA